MSKTLIVSWSELDAARQCPHKHQLSYVERWTRPTTASTPLLRGSLWHAVMERHYQVLKEKGPKGTTAAELARAVQPFLTPDIGQRSEHQELIAWMYAGYVEMWGLDPDWEIVAIEHPALFWLPTPRGGRSRFRLKVKIDLVVRERRPNGKLQIVDHKSGGNLPNDKMLEIDDQFGLYTWGLHQMGKRVFGQIHNAARTQRNKAPMALDERFRRTPLYRSDRELEVIALEAYETMAARYRAGAAHQRHPDSDRCRWRCDYLDACLHGRKVGEAAERSYLQMAGYVQDFTRH